MRIVGDIVLVVLGVTVAVSCTSFALLMLGYPGETAGRDRGPSAATGDRAGRVRSDAGAGTRSRKKGGRVLAPRVTRPRMAARHGTNGVARAQVWLRRQNPVLTPR